MRKIAIAVLLVMLVCSAPALAQVPPNVELPEQTDVIGDDQYEETTPELQSIENGLEDAGDHADGGAAVGGAGAYFDALDNENPASATTLPSSTYTELPDTGGFSPVLILAAGVLILGGVLLFVLAVSRRQ